jgi:hypothetical protein
MSKGWIGVDFDGTLAYYDRWRGEQHLGKPVPRMVKLVQRLIKEGNAVKVFTARVAATDDRDPEVSRQLIADWTEKHVGTRLEVTNIKDFGMIKLYDDRAVQVITNTGQRVVRKDAKK